jgi:hypothetical protein
MQGGRLFLLIYKSRSTAKWPLPEKIEAKRTVPSRTEKDLIFKAA